MVVPLSGSGQPDGRAIRGRFLTASLWRPFHVLMDGTDPRPLEDASSARLGLGDLVPGAQRVLLFGGTFDPPHTAHLELACQARNWLSGKIGADAEAWLVLVPAARSPHKDTGPMASDEDRVRMLELACAGLERVAVWTGELDRAQAGEPSYWVETLECARRELGEGVDLRFLMGADQVGAFTRWCSYRKILELAQPVVMLRPPLSDAKRLESALEAARVWSADERAWWQRCIAPVEVRPTNATAIREALTTGERLGGVLHPDVERYIRAHGLYRSDS